MVTKLKTDKYGIAEYLCDTVDDIENLPKANPGSIALIIENNVKYIVNNSKNWVELGNV